MVAWQVQTAWTRYGTPHGVLREIPIDIVCHHLARGGSLSRVDGTDLFGDFTPATRASKTCFMGVAVEADDVCGQEQRGQQEQGRTGAEACLPSSCCVSRGNT